MVGIIRSENPADLEALTALVHKAQPEVVFTWLLSLLSVEVTRILLERGLRM